MPWGARALLANTVVTSMERFNLSSIGRGRGACFLKLPRCIQSQMEWESISVLSLERAVRQVAKSDLCCSGLGVALGHSAIP